MFGRLWYPAYCMDQSHGEMYIDAWFCICTYTYMCMCMFGSAPKENCSFLNIILGAFQIPKCMPIYSQKPIHIFRQAYWLSPLSLEWEWHMYVLSVSLSLGTKLKGSTLAWILHYGLEIGFGEVCIDGRLYAYVCLHCSTFHVLCTFRNNVQTFRFSTHTVPKRKGMFTR